MPLENILSINQIIRRLTEGTTEPFLCECDDGHKYVVKGQPRMTRKELMAEWISAGLAESLGLSIPGFGLVYIQPELIAYAKSEWRDDLREGHAFACQFIEPSTPINFYQAHTVVNKQSRKFIYLFDKWVNNADRTLAFNGLGNVNMLFSLFSNQYYLIDHNLAFYKDYNQVEFQTHVYCPDNRDWTYDMVDRIAFRDSLQDALQDFDSLIDTIPDDWILDNECAQNDYIAYMKATIERVVNDDFWSEIE
ncbi:HipA family kinase [Brenneria populi subsp. brevivirga]|uniref:HipA family kinase n=1 Tax=Brenneria populi TaxID=1505588 RepID=UPI002E183CAB|nr:HipA family kinase [Brenneria populi subsp. brevivirga]